MRLVLALDTSGDRADVAVLREDAGRTSMLARERVMDGMRHGVELFPAIERALATAGHPARDLDLVAVGTGPGSFTGLRIGITAARALAYATGAELLGVPSCDALAQAVPVGETSVAYVADSRAGRVYLAVYERDRSGELLRTTAPEVLAAEVARSRLPKDPLVVGDAMDAHPHVFRDLRRALDLAAPEAVEIGRIALARASRGERERIDSVVPLYLSRTAAERNLDGATNSGVTQ